MKNKRGISKITPATYSQPAGVSNGADGNTFCLGSSDVELSSDTAGSDFLGAGPQVLIHAATNCASGQSGKTHKMPSARHSTTGSVPY